MLIIQTAIDMFLRGDDIDLLVTAKASHKENIFSLKPAKRKTAEELYSERILENKNFP